MSDYFNLRPPRGGRPFGRLRQRQPRRISIHALLTEGDRLIDRFREPVDRFQSTPSSRRATRYVEILNKMDGISIHALLAEGDQARAKVTLTYNDFNPRPPHGGRPTFFFRDPIVFPISIHALLTEGDRRRCKRNTQIAHFNPRPPHGGRHPPFSTSRPRS